MRKILVVDDEPAVRGFIRIALRGMKCDILEASDGAEALAAVRSAHPDLVLLDIRMPGMDGVEVLRELRKSPPSKSLPVIFLTSTVLDVDELVSVLELDPSDFVTKEVSSRELIARIEWVLRRHVDESVRSRQTR